MRFLQRVAQRLNPHSGILFALLLVTLVLIVRSLVRIVHDLETGLLLLMAISGLVIGWMLSGSRLPKWLVVLLVTTLGVVAIVLRIGRLGDELFAILGRTFSLYLEIWQWILEGPLPDWSQVGWAVVELAAGTGTVLVRWWDWMQSLLAGNPAFDPVAAALMWTWAVWTVATWAGWMVRRYHPLPGLVPAMALSAGTHYFSRAKPFGLLPLLGLGLLAIAYSRHVARESRWKTSGVDGGDLGVDILRATTWLSLALMGLAVLVPAVSLQDIIELAQTAGQRQAGETEPLAESLGVERRSEPVQETILDEVRVRGLPNRHLLGGEPELSEEVVMVVCMDDPSPDPPSHYYWRSLTYDRYYQWGWYTRDTETVAYAAGEPAITQTLPAQVEVRQRVQTVGDMGGLLYTAGQLISAEPDYAVAWRQPEDPFGGMMAADIYQAVSRMSVAGEEMLQDTGNDYPEWVRNHYLDLPGSVPVRVWSLARDLTATEPTPYGRARAIEDYLRTLPYTLDIEAPPYERDVVDYFLFDLQRGYCDYYASAMVVLSRAAGLPARLVTGYVGGVTDPDTACYIVSKAHAHTWVEIYFPGYGWVEFEPTGSLPKIERSVGEMVLEWPEVEAEPEEEAGGWARLDNLWLGEVGALVLLVLAILFWWGMDTWWLHRLGPEATIIMLYQKLWRHTHRLDVSMPMGTTPYECALYLAERVTFLAQQSRRGHWLTPISDQASCLIEFYVQVSYSPRRPSDAARGEAIRIWKRLRWRLWLAWLWQRGLLPKTRAV